MILIKKQCYGYVDLRCNCVLHTLVLGGPETTVPWEYQRRATGVIERETNNLVADIMVAILLMTSRWQWRSEIG